MTSTNGQRLTILANIADRLMTPYPYHNSTHAREVYTAATGLATLENCTAHEQFLLGSAGLLHDIISIPGRKDNEERTAQFAREYLPQLDYTASDIRQVSELILATKMPQQPRTDLERILCDADLDNLGREDFLEKNEALRQELGAAKDHAWYEHSLSFLRNHEYHTSSAHALRSDGKVRNIALVEDLLRSYS